MSAEQPPRPQARRRADVRGGARGTTPGIARRATRATVFLAALAGAGTGAACRNDGGPRQTYADAPAAGAAAATPGQPVNPTSLNPGASLRRDTTGAPYDASAADSVERQAAASATGETARAIIGNNSGMQLPSNLPVSQVGAGPTVTQRDGGGDRYRGGPGAAASAWIDDAGHAHYTDAGGREMSPAQIRGRMAAPAVAMGADVIATGSVAAYQPNATDAPGAAARNGSPLAAGPGTMSGAQSALSPAGAVDRNVAWGGASPEVAAKLARGTRVAPLAPAVGDSARPASPGGPINAAVPNAVLAPTAANARAVLTLINSGEIAAGRAGEERLTTPSLRQLAAAIRRDHEGQLARLEGINGQPALTPAQRAAVGRALSEQSTSLRTAQGGSANFDTQWISAQVAAHEKALNDLRALAPAVQGGPLAAYVAQLTAGVQAHLQQAQRLQARPGSSAPAAG